MSEQNEVNNQSKKKGMPKKVISILIALLLVSGVGVAAFFLMGGSSDKAKYFQAEAETYTFIEEKVKERFDLELDWLKFTENNAIESTVDVSATFNDPGFFGYGMMFDLEDIINNANITVTSEQDMKNKQATANLDVNVAGLEFTDFRFGLTDELVLVDLPFLNETLKLESKDTGKLLHMADPYTFDEDTEFDFSQFFDTEYTVFTEEDKKHFKEQYGESIYKEIKDDSFTSEKETIDLDGEKIKAEKIKLTLENDELKRITKLVLEKAQKDDYLKAWLRDQFEKSFTPQDEIDEMLAEFDESIATAIEEIDNSEVELNLSSTIWIDKNLIVKRDLVVDSIEANDDESSITIVGTQLFDNKTQTFDYNFGFSDDYSDESFNIAGKLSDDGGKIKDSIVLDVDEAKITYESDETVANKTREFTRTIGFDDGWSEGALVWAGDATYEKDQMTGSHQLYVEMEDFGQDLFTLHLDVTGKKIKAVNMLDDANSVDIGTMSEEELDDYFENDVAEQFMQWYFDMFGDMGDLFY